jgi:hypothetical protein
MGVIDWISPNLVLANSPVGVEIIEILAEHGPGQLHRPPFVDGTVPWTDDEGRAGHEAIYEQVDGYRRVHKSRLRAMVNMTEMTIMAFQGTLTPLSGLVLSSWASLWPICSEARGNVRNATLSITVSAIDNTIETTSQCTWPG